MQSERDGVLLPTDFIKKRLDDSSNVIFLLGYLRGYSYLLERYEIQVLNIWVDLSEYFLLMNFVLIYLFQVS